MEINNTTGSSILGIHQNHDKENIFVIDENQTTVNYSSILQQFEFYFSDSNILKDQFLIRKIKSCKDGWVNLKTMENFPKVKALSNNHLEIIKALSDSLKLELSEDGKSIRRRDPLPLWDNSVYFRTLIISDFPIDEDITVETVMDLFKDTKCPVSLVRMWSPGKKIQPDLKRFQTCHPQLSIQLCAIVEFFDTKATSEAILVIRSKWNNIYVKMLNDRGDKLNAGKLKKYTSKEIPSESRTYERRPLIFKGLDDLENQIRVIHVREPTAPPTEGSPGFNPCWRDLLRSLYNTEIDNVDYSGTTLPLNDDVINIQASCVS